MKHRRSSLVILTFLSASALALTGCSGTGNPAADAAHSASPEANSSASGTLTVATQGGTFQTVELSTAVPGLAKSDPDVKVQFDVGDFNTIPTKVKTQASSKVGSIDLVELQNTNLQQLAQQGLLAKIDLSKLKNAKYIQEGLDNTYWIPQVQTGGTIVYNTKTVKPAPTSYADLFNGKYKGKVGALNYQQYLYAAASYAKGNKNPGTDWDAGWPTLEKVAPDMQYFTSWDLMGQAMASGQIDIGIAFKSRSTAWLSAGGASLAQVVPKAGALTTLFGVGIPKNAPNPEAAYAYLDQLLSPAVQQSFSKTTGYAPVITNAGLSPELLKQVSFPADQEKNLVQTNTEYVVKHDADWAKKWQQDIATK
jgi:putative spermidine/putrescine transport system substrate-binding protein